MQDCGIYCFTNKENGKQYVGQSIKLYKRKMSHFYEAFDLEKQKKDVSILHSAFRKYGLDSFNYEILEYCSPELLNEREEYWVNEKKSFVLDGGYNLTLGGRGGKKPFFFKDDLLLSYWNQNMTVNFIRRNYGSSEEKIKEQLNLLGISNEEITQRGKDKVEEVTQISNIKRRKITAQYTLDGVLINTFSSLSEAAKSINRAPGAISSAANGKIKSAYGYKWEYIDIK